MPQGAWLCCFVVRVLLRGMVWNVDREVHIPAGREAGATSFGGVCVCANIVRKSAKPQLSMLVLSSKGWQRGHQ